MLHPTSLPGDAPVGNLGADARRFVDLLAEIGLSVWQVLPLGPTAPLDSPYQSESAHAGSHWLISLEPLRERGWLNGDDEAPPAAVEDWTYWHGARLRRAREGFLAHAERDDRHAYERFCEERGDWLDDYALFRALSHEHDGRPWWEWTAELRRRDPAALRETRARLAEVLDQHRFEQFLFSSQWTDLRRYANERGVLLFGDMPIFVAHNSADVWAEPHYFDLDETGRPGHVAGVPPDYFSATGQRWGNPLYNWDVMQADGFAWWERRLRSMETQFDLIRVDHFRGFEAYWAIPADEETAIRGKWVKAPGEALFRRLRERLGDLPLVAEDLGTITPEVEALRDAWGLPGMKILQFAFGDDFPEGAYLPHNYSRNSAVYTGTHDNNTVLGWYLNEANKENKHKVSLYADKEINESNVCWEFIKLGMMSSVKYAVFPIQDVLGLGQEARFNLPSTTRKNWIWRINKKMLSQDISNKLAHLTYISARNSHTS